MPDTSTVLINEANVFVKKYKRISNNYTLAVKKEILVGIIPASIYHGVRAQRLDNYKDEDVTPDFVIKILRQQTMGRDFVSYIIFIEKFQLKFTKDLMIIFTDQFKPTFQNYDKNADLKQEPFIIDWILRILSTHEIIKDYKKYYTAKLQEPIENITGIEPKLYDLVFHDIHIAIEIDESHEGVYENDSYKNSNVRLSGYVLIRINSKKIINQIKGKRCDMDYIKHYKEIIIRTFLGALIDIKDVRSKILLWKFECSIKEEMSEIKKTISNIKDDYEMGDRSDNDCLEEITELRKTLKRKQDLLLDFHNKDTMELFELKHKTFGDQNKKIISIEVVCKLLKILDESGKRELIKFIKFNALCDKNLNVSWEGITQIIMEYDRVNQNTRLLINQYYRKVESTYEFM